MKKKNKGKWDMEPQKSSAAQYLTYIASYGISDEKFEIRYEDENIWMSQKMLAAVYGVEVPNVAYHLRKIFTDGEIDKDTSIKEILIDVGDGRKFAVNHYNLRVIIALGFKIDKIVFTCKSAKLGYDATARCENGEFVIQPGAHIRREPVKSFLTSKPDAYHNEWLKLMRKSDGTGVIKDRIPCTSPAMAASIVCASSRNGNDEWVDNNWLGDRQHTLGEYLCRETRRSMKDEGDE